MPRITEIRARRASKRRADVYVDGELLLTVDRSFLKENKLAVGSEADIDELTETASIAEPASALEAAYTFLEVRMRTKREVTDRLNALGYAPDTVEATLAKLEELRFVDDEYFAARWAEERLRGRSASVVKGELKRKGISAELVDAVETDPEHEADKCYAVCIRAMRGQSDLNAARRKAANACARRGYDWDAINEALSRATAELAGDGDSFE